MTLRDSLVWMGRCQRCTRTCRLNARGRCAACAHDDVRLALQGAVFLVVALSLVGAVGWGFVRLLLWVLQGVAS